MSPGLLLLAAAAHGQCPGSGDCCVANGTPGCEDLVCCVEVCVTDPFCCEIQWDALCADVALATCAACGSGCPGTGDCCLANPTPGCNDAFCCTLVCTADPFCCDTVWDEACATQATGLCTICQTSDCPGSGDCCVNNGTPGCNDVACCQAICDLDPACCDFWDGICAGEAQKLCTVCEPVCADPQLVPAQTFVTPDEAFGGEQLAVVYRVSNASECAFTIRLLASAAPVAGGPGLESPECESVLAVAPQSVVTLARCFNLPIAIVPGLYEFCYEIRDFETGVTLDVFCRNDLVVLSLGDLDGDGVVGQLDFLILLAEWGPCLDADDCRSDLSRDGAVNMVDLLILLAHWGPVSPPAATAARSGRGEPGDAATARARAAAGA